MSVLAFTGLEQAKASKVAEALGVLLADFQIFYSNLRGYHWHVRGANFFTLHAHFEKMYDGVAETVDELAERILQLGGVPENRFSRYIEQSNLRETHNVSNANEILNDILESYRLLIAQERSVLALAEEAEDEVTIALVGDLLASQEKDIWMIEAFRG